MESHRAKHKYIVFEVLLNRAQVNTTNLLVNLQMLHVPLKANMGIVFQEIPINKKQATT